MITTDDWRLDEGDMDMIRLVCSDASGGMGVRSVQGGLEAGAMFAPIQRPIELRCGPVYVRTPKREATGVELTDQHLAVAREEKRARRCARMVAEKNPAAWRILRICYGERPVGKLEAFGEVAPLILERPTPAAIAAHARAVAQDRTHGDLGPWLLHLSHRIAKARQDGRPVNEDDLRASREIADEVRPAHAAACRLWKQARQRVFPSRRIEVRGG